MHDVAADPGIPEGGITMITVRISRGAFNPADYDRIAKLLDESRLTLVPGIRQLKGCLHYWAGIDRSSNTMVNVSVWRSLNDARQMETLTEMKLLADEFTRLGVRFERPINNYDVRWEI
jgi:quinol monooxygenase YgiN